jgi:hypothetical protein
MGIADTLISGQLIIVGANTLTCVGTTYNGSFQPLGESCQ